jgi:hypothetical protein
MSIVAKLRFSRLLILKPPAESSRCSDETGTEQHHARRLRNCFDYFTTTKANLSHVLENGAISAGQTDRLNQLSVNGSDSEKVLAIGVDREIVFEKTTIDVDTLNVNDD